MEHREVSGEDSTLPQKRSFRDAPAAPAETLEKKRRLSFASASPLHHSASTFTDAATSHADSNLPVNSHAQTSHAAANPASSRAPIASRPSVPSNQKGLKDLKGLSAASREAVEWRETMNTILVPPQRDLYLKYFASVASGVADREGGQSCLLLDPECLSYLIDALTFFIGDVFALCATLWRVRIDADIHATFSDLIEEDFEQVDRYEAFRALDKIQRQKKSGPTSGLGAGTGLVGQGGLDGGNEVGIELQQQRTQEAILVARKQRELRADLSLQDLLTSLDLSLNLDPSIDPPTGLIGEEGDVSSVEGLGGEELSEAAERHMREKGAHEMAKLPPRLQKTYRKLAAFFYGPFMEKVVKLHMAATR